MSLSQETAANFEAFFKAWTVQAAQNVQALHAEPQYLTSYRRIAAFQALKIDLIVPRFEADSAAFFQEAHNDALVSHVSASYGAWRSALKSLRSLIQNALASLYYADHPIELANWVRGRGRIGFSELMKYFRAHPRVDNVEESISGLARIESEYATLSKAVHASAKDFRMTDDIAQILLWSTKKEKIAKWSTRERETITGVSQLVIALYRDHLTGAQRSQLRESLGYVIGPTLRSNIKAAFGITIPAPQ